MALAVRARPRAPALASARTARRRAPTARAERGGGFATGFVVGGLIFGALGFVFAPQLSKRLLGEEEAPNLPAFLDDDDESLEVTRQTLNDKIAQLNEAIDDVSAQLLESDEAKGEDDGGRTGVAASQ